ncbi:hypothetical protein RclHR1_08080007 [Rhizophagus clarus]|uniref:Uncharacterized protein n=1 Tax=Rhizophagus clarus TaxID=94130 RepID=A0A2Z6S6B2_9GLOM|nr:hypothetical protein RclHR1_08080007 [Rhizophagus clarus]GES80955.1 hypothetical protein GLOIN_2v190066 [Rhizophagus clarus]
MGASHSSGNDELFNNCDAQISMIEFGRGMRKLMINFQNCTERPRRYNAISDHIRETRRLRNMFRVLVRDSLEFNRRLSDYSLDISFFVRCFNNPDDYSDDDILVLLDGLLERARENLELSRELKGRIRNEDGSGINDVLFQIQNSLPGRVDEINDEISEELNRRRLSALIPRGNNLVSAVVRYTIAFFIDVRRIYHKLDDIVTIKDFDDSLTSIILGVGKIENFWETQTERIEYLIGNLGTGRHIERQRVVFNLEQKWKNVERECQIYNRVMNDVLNRDRLNRIS